MSRRLLAAAAVAASVIVAPVVADQPIAASPNQIEIWSNHSHSQTSNSYWMPTGPSFRQPNNYNSPDYRGGQAYIRIQVTSKPTNVRMQPRVCFWRHGSTRFQFETCAYTNGNTFTSNGVMYMALGSPGNWWKKNGVWDWSRPADVGRIMLSKPGGRLFLDNNCGQACYDGPGSAAAHLPVSMTSTMIFVPRGQTLTKPANWGDCPASVCGTAPSSSPSPTPPPPAPAPTPPPPSGSATTPTVNVTPGDRSLATTWNHPSANLFQYRYKRANSDQWNWDQPTNNRSRNVNGLTNGTTYNVEVRAYLDGSWRAWNTVNATPAGGGGNTPPPPTSGGTVTSPGSANTATVSVTPGSRSLATTWNHPSARLFQYRYKAANASQWNWDQPTNNRSRTVTGLSGGTRYDVEVRAYLNGAWRAWNSVRVAPAS